MDYIEARELGEANAVQYLGYSVQGREWCVTAKMAF